VKFFSELIKNLNNIISEEYNLKKIIFFIVYSINKNKKNIMSIKKVVEGGYCIGCGLCNNSLDQKTEIKFDKFGQYQLTSKDSQPLDDSENSKALEVCPFSGKGPDENDIGKLDYNESSNHDHRIGYYKNLYVSHVKNREERKKSTSGGIITFIAKQLLERKLVDYVVHVKKDESEDSNAMFSYGISDNINELERNTKSRYYPIEMSKVVETMRDIPGKYLVIGLPCFIKGIKRLAAIDSIINERVKFTIGLVCGHLKSKGFSEMYAVQSGILPEKLRNIDFRVKNDTGTARTYSVLVEGDDKSVVKRSNEFYGTHWGYNFFRYSACDYCDDVFAETADISVGDAWLDGYIDDPMGNSVVVVRNNTIGLIVKEAQQNNLLFTESISADLAAKSQAGGIRDRRSGLSFRLYLKQKAKKWAPKKRVEPTKGNLKFFRKLILKNRIVLRENSHYYWLKSKRMEDFNYFKKKMSFYVHKNSLLYLLSNNISDIIRSIKRL
jgi:coenzyme F420-reducing hydrogenase beta subunit